MATKRKKSPKQDPGGILVERRRSRRFEVAWNVSINGVFDGHNFNEAGQLHDLSSGGAFVFTTRKFEVGEKMEVLIRVPFQSEKWMKYSAEVVRVEPGKELVGVAFRFKSFRPVFQGQGH